MTKQKSPFSPGRAVFRFAVLLLSALALQGIPFLFTLLEGDAGVLLYVVYLYAVLPILSILIPCWAGLGGVHPLAAFWPIGLALLILPVYESPGMGILCMVLSMLGAVGGQEWQKRKGADHGKHPGSKKKKRTR